MSAAGQAEGGQRSLRAPEVPEQQALEAEIEQTREELGQTVAALAAKADVKARATNKTRQLTGQLKGTAGQAKKWAAGQAAGARRATLPVQQATVSARQQPVLLAAGAAMAAGIVLIIWGSRR